MMNTASKRTLHIIEQIVKPISIGTNLGLLQLIWSLMQGSFLISRGAIHTALKQSGFTIGEIRRSWAALRYGQWTIEELINQFHEEVKKEGSWQARTYGGKYRAMSIDLTAIWRPRLQKWLMRPYRQLTGKGFKGIAYGLIVRVGEVSGQRMALLQQIVRPKSEEKTEEPLKIRTLKKAVSMAEENEVLIHDRGVTISEMQKVGANWYVVRMRSNAVAQKNSLDPQKRKGGKKAVHGKKVRVLPGTYRDKQIEATKEDVSQEFSHAGVKVKARGFFDLVHSRQKASPDNPTFSLWEIDDPRYEESFVLGTNLPAETEPKVIYQMYIDRWPVEQLPLVTKQLLGGHRQFVFNHTSCFRLAELAFLAGNLLTWLALILPAYPSGFWDRRPKKRRDDSEESWLKRHFVKYPFLNLEFAEKPRLRPIFSRELRPIGDLKTASIVFVG